MIKQFEDMKFICDNMFDGNKARMLRIVSDGLKLAKKENNIVLYTTYVCKECGNLFAIGETRTGKIGDSS